MTLGHYWAVGGQVEQCSQPRPEAAAGIWEQEHESIWGPGRQPRKLCRGLQTALV